MTPDKQELFDALSEIPAGLGDNKETATLDDEDKEHELTTGADMSKSYLLFGDESQRSPSREFKFFVYSALAVPIEAARRLHNEIDEIRREYGYGATDILKHSGRDRRLPSLEPGENCLAAAARAGCALYTSYVHHGVVKGNQQRAVEYGINGSLMWFETLLDKQDACGICLLDQQEKLLNHLSKVFTGQIKVGVGNLSCAHVVALGVTRIAASHLISCADLAAGAMRWVSGGRTLSEKTQSALAKMVSHGGRTQLNPQQVNNSTFKEDYKALEEALRSHRL